MEAEYTLNWDENVAEVFRHFGTDTVIEYSWTVRLGNRVRLDMRDELVPDSPPNSNPMVVERGEYEYHATIEEDGDIKRIGGPDHGKRPPVAAAYAKSMIQSDQLNRHWFHHIDQFHPFTNDDSDLRFIDPQDSPNLEEFCYDMLGWWHQNKHLL
jgi:hypothetical protein